MRREVREEGRAGGRQKKEWKRDGAMGVEWEGMWRRMTTRWTVPHKIFYDQKSVNILTLNIKTYERVYAYTTHRTSVLCEECVCVFGSEAEMLAKKTAKLLAHQVTDRATGYRVHSHGNLRLEIAFW